MKGFFFFLLKWAHRNTKSRQTLTKDRQQATKGPSNYCFFKKKKKVGRLSHHQPTSGIDNLLLLLLPVLIVLHAPLVSVRVKKSDHKSAECAFWVSSNNQSTTQSCVLWTTIRSEMMPWMWNWLQRRCEKNIYLALETSEKAHFGQIFPHGCVNFCTQPKLLWRTADISVFHIVHVIILRFMF